MAKFSCPCGLPNDYGACCGLAHQNPDGVETAERLMRSRYSAFVKGEIDYLRKTLNPNQQEEFDAEAAADWSKNSEWLGLEIINTENGDMNDNEGTVEFRATFDSGQGPQVHHELSHFRRVEGRWYYWNGSAVAPPVLGRNDPCLCGSGKKYKKCCMQKAE